MTLPRVTRMRCGTNEFLTCAKNPESRMRCRVELRAMAWRQATWIPVGKVTLGTPWRRALYEPADYDPVVRGRGRADEG